MLSNIFQLLPFWKSNYTCVTPRVLRLWSFILFSSPLSSSFFWFRWFLLLQICMCLTVLCLEGHWYSSISTFLSSPSWCISFTLHISFFSSWSFTYFLFTSWVLHYAYILVYIYYHIYQRIFFKILFLIPIVLTFLDTLLMIWIPSRYSSYFLAFFLYGLQFIEF